uniref:Uncharacterized protein n=1 Tax=viral metagenome TaxID=1070528 RepID=A0A6C0CFG1_9ZZZZ
MAQQPTYHELLADIYEENAANQYVFDRFYEEEDVDAYDEDKYDDHEVQDKEAFNKFAGNRTKPENVVKPAPSTNEQGKASYGYNKDIRTTIVNIDGRFRVVPIKVPARITREQCLANESLTANFGDSSGTQFSVMLARQYKNVTSIKVQSLEFENSFYTFTHLDSVTGIGRENTTMKFIVYDDTDPFNPVEHTLSLTIPDGNYVVSTPGATGPTNGLIETIAQAITAEALVKGITGSVANSISIIQNPQSLKLTFNFAWRFHIEFPETVDAFTQNGLGYNLGFYNTLLNISESNLLMPPVWSLTTNTRPDVIQDRYIYIVINDWAQVHHQYSDQTELAAFLKVPLTVPKFEVQYDNTALDTDTKEFFFPQPVNIQKLEISLVDQYGAILDMQGGSFSMSLAINEILQSNIYEKLLQM